MDEPADLSSQDRPGWHLLDECVSTRIGRSRLRIPPRAPFVQVNGYQASRVRFSGFGGGNLSVLLTLLRLQTASSGDCCRRAGGLTATRVLR
jgi:hypothetical protein